MYSAEGAGKNQILARLPPPVYARLSPHLEYISLEPGQVLLERYTQLDHAYFSVNGLILLVYESTNGHTVGQAIIGNDGVAGTALVLGGQTMSSSAVAPCEGAAYRLHRDPLRREFERGAELHDLLLRYVESLLTQATQTAACNRLHSVEQRLCRWILTSTDRMDGSHLTITHEFFGYLLGVRRESVSIAAARLRELGAISYQRGCITIIDRPQLEKLCCECYQVTNMISAHLMHDPFGAGPGRM